MERGVEHGHVRNIGRDFHRDLDAGEIRGIVQRRQRHDLAYAREHGFIDQRGLREGLAAVHHAVPDRGQLIDIVHHLRLTHRLPDQVERSVMVRDRLFVDALLLYTLCVEPAVFQPAPALADTVEHARSQHAPGVHLEQLVFYRRAAAVDHQNLHAQSFCAWIAVIATVLTMSGTVQPRLRSLTGLFRPCNTGPIASVFAERCTAL